MIAGNGAFSSRKQYPACSQTKAGSALTVRYRTHMDASKTSPNDSRPSSARGAVRWIVALGWAGLVAFALPAGETPAGLALQAVAYFVLSFLLVNALRRRMTVRSACAMAVIGACLLISWSEALESIVLDQPVPDTLVPGLIGSIVGAAAAFPAFKRIRRAESLRAARRERDRAAR
ncbi:hypothetical protein [Eggerthella timonensis]|uniref:hypothetical protein n=1 Tax=Eggerthella timonensis TaxID=1871008 RepID=UPI000C77C4BD|nr:hypothetical protein [Eggerthella timonensis]